MIEAWLLPSGVGLAGLGLGLLAGALYGKRRGMESNVQALAGARLDVLRAERDSLVDLLRRRTVDFKGWPPKNKKTWVVQTLDSLDIRRESLVDFVVSKLPDKPYYRCNMVVIVPNDQVGVRHHRLPLVSGDRGFWGTGAVIGVFGLKKDVDATVRQQANRVLGFMRPDGVYSLILEFAMLEVVERPEVRFVEVPFIPSPEPDSDTQLVAARKAEAMRIAAQMEVDPEMGKEVKRLLQKNKESAG